MTKNIYFGHTPFPEAELTCRQVTALLVDYMAGDMDTLTRMAFEAHLRYCSACTAFLATYNVPRVERDCQTHQVWQRNQNVLHVARAEPSSAPEAERPLA